MEQRPGSEPTPSGEYGGGYTPHQQPDSYSQEEMPQSTYPGQSYSGYQSSQQQQQPPYGQQQQQYYQPPFGQYGGDVASDERTSMGLRARTAGLLSYLFLWVTGIIFLLLEKENRFVRFHAAQSIILFGGLGILQAIFSAIPYLGFISGGLGFVVFICWIFMMYTAYKGRYYKLPIVGDYAERLANAIK
jgi:uncharacterized membrane protein